MYRIGYYKRNAASMNDLFLYWLDETYDTYTVAEAATNRKNRALGYDCEPGKMFIVPDGYKFYMFSMVNEADLLNPDPFITRLLSLKAVLAPHEWETVRHVADLIYPDKGLHNL